MNNDEHVLFWTADGVEITVFLKMSSSQIGTLNLRQMEYFTIKAASWIFFWSNSAVSYKVSWQICMISKRFCSLYSIVSNVHFGLKILLESVPLGEEDLKKSLLHYAPS